MMSISITLRSMIKGYLKDNVDPKDHAEAKKYLHAFIDYTAEALRDRIHNEIVG